MSYQPSSFSVTSLPSGPVLAHAPQENAHWLRRLHALVEGDGERAWNDGPRLWTQAGLRGRRRTPRRLAPRRGLGPHPRNAPAPRHPSLVVHVRRLSVTPPGKSPDPPAILFAAADRMSFRNLRVASSERAPPPATALMPQFCSRQAVARPPGSRSSPGLRARHRRTRPRLRARRGRGRHRRPGSGIDEPTLHPAKHGRSPDVSAKKGPSAQKRQSGAPGEPYRFPQRNRLIAGLAQAVVVEAADGLPLITANPRRTGTGCAPRPVPSQAPLAGGVNRPRGRRRPLPGTGRHPGYMLMDLSPSARRRPPRRSPADRTDHKIPTQARKRLICRRTGRRACILILSSTAPLAAWRREGWVERRSPAPSRRVAGLVGRTGRTFRDFSPFGFGLYPLYAED